MIFIGWHLGLGDAIACAAIVVKLAKTGDEIMVPCFDKNEESVKSFFIDYPNVIVRKESDKIPLMISESNSVLNLGYYNKDLPQLPDEDFVQWFYRQAGMDISEKELYCPIKKAAEKCDEFVIKLKNFSFSHDDEERGFIIKREKVKLKPSYRPFINGTILHHAGLMLKAKEIHCIDSSFVHLAEALGVTGDKYYHKYARPESTEFKYLKDWNVFI